MTGWSGTGPTGRGSGVRFREGRAGGGCREAGGTGRGGRTSGNRGDSKRRRRVGGLLVGVRRRPAVFGGLAAALVAFVAGGCAGAAGGGGSEDAPSLPNQRRTVVRVGGYRPVDIYNEPGVGIRTIDVAAATVWRVVGGVYAQLEIPIEHTNPPVMEIGNQGYRARRIGGDRMNTFVDCGSDLSGPLANRYDITLSVITRITSKGEESSEILTIVDAFGRPSAVSGNPIHCQSRGTLEQRVAQAIATALGREP